MPPLIGREPLGRKTNLGSHAEFEFVIRDFQEG
jgi:hypothetical protein